MCRSNYLWAYSTYTSRGFVGHLGRTAASASLPLVNNFVAGELCGCLIPLEDMFNHKYRKSVTWESNEDSVRFVTGDTIHQVGVDRSFLCLEFGIGFLWF
jgi:hypothetical protein